MSNFYYVEFSYDAYGRRIYDKFVIFSAGVKTIEKDMVDDPSFPNLEIKTCELYSDILRSIGKKRDDDGNLPHKFWETLERQEFDVDWEFDVNPQEIPYWRGTEDKDGDVY